MSETQGVPQITGKMFLFERPELMNKEQHGDLGFKRPEERFGFCAKARAVPVTVSEIPAAMRDYPIIFMSKEQLVPLAVTGLVDDVNLFVDEKGEWEENRYIPGYVRRYPFGIASETGGERFAIVIDAAYEGFSKDAETPLFDNGEPSQATQQAVDFCTTYERDRQMTEEFGKRIAGYDIVQGQSAQFTPVGETEPRTFAEYFSVDESRMKALTDEQFLELHKAGLLPVLYAMLMSMGNWRALLQRRAKRFNLTETEILNRPVN